LLLDVRRRRPDADVHTIDCGSVRRRVLHRDVRRRERGSGVADLQRCLVPSGLRWLVEQLGQLLADLRRRQSDSYVQSVNGGCFRRGVLHLEVRRREHRRPVPELLCCLVPRGLCWVVEQLGRLLVDLRRRHSDEDFSSVCSSSFRRLVLYIGVRRRGRRCPVPDVHGGLMPRRL
jgi:hypothetical protein